MNEEHQLEFLKDLLSDICENGDIYYDDFDDTKIMIIDTMKLVFDDLNLNLVNYNLNKLLKFKYEYDPDLEGKVIYHKKNITIPDDYQQLVDHVDFIANIPQPEQRTQEWFDMRKNMITASCAAQAVGENPYSGQKPEHLILDKLGLGPKFKDNKFVHHGKKYEEVATKIYENVYDIMVKEYGLVPHVSKFLEKDDDKKILFVGASPDGIGSRYTLSNEFSPLIGRMLEIKCPYSRTPKLKGKIDGEICPHYYHCQVQQQLECCYLEECDFWQCVIKEFTSKEDLLDDESELTYKEEQEQDLHVPENCRRGCIIQLLPKNKITRFCLFDAKYIYPPDINMSLFEYDQWVLDELTNLNSKHPKLMYNYVFDRVLYWKLTLCHNVVVKRDHGWFKKVLPEFRILWDRIVHLRNNKKDLLEFQTMMEKRKRPRKKKTYKEELFVDSDSSEEMPIKKKKKKKKEIKIDIVDEDLFVDSD